MSNLTYRTYLANACMTATDGWLFAALHKNVGNPPVSVKFPNHDALPYYLANFAPQR
jgi:hypothetical protein